MRYLLSKAQGIHARSRCFWLAGLAVCIVMAQGLVSSLYGQTPSLPEAQRSSPEPSPASPPPALPLSATERVMELSLQDAIRLALQDNLDLAQARFRPQIAHTDVEEARAAFDPIVGLEASISQTKVLPKNQTITFDPQTGAQQLMIIKPFSKDGAITPTLKQKIITGGGYELRFVNTRENIAPAAFGISSAIADPRYESHLELTFTQPLLKDFGIAVNTAAIRQARKAAEIAAQQVIQTILNVVFAVQQSYWNLVFRIQDLDAKRKSLKLAEDFLTDNQARVELGTLAPIELVQAKTRVKTRQGDVIVAEAAVEEAEDQLKEVLNIPETLGTWRIRLRPTDSPPYIPISAISLQKKVAQALKNRPDIVQSQLQIEALEIGRQAARNQRLPRLDLQSQGRLEAFAGGFPDSLANLRNAEGYSWSIGLRFEYPLGNRFARNELHKQELELQRALVAQRKLKRTIARQIRRAVRDIETASKRVEVTRAATVLAQAQLEAEQEKFRLGLSTSFNVLEFQEDLTIARSNETRAISDYNIALARLDQLTGTLRYTDVTAGLQRKK